MAFNSEGLGPQVLESGRPSAGHVPVSELQESPEVWPDVLM